MFHVSNQKFMINFHASPTIFGRMDLMHNRLTFDLGNKREINYHSWKEHTKISKIARFSGEIL